MKRKAILVFNASMGIVYSFLTIFSFFLYYGDYNKRFHEDYITPTSKDKIIAVFLFYGFPLLMFLINYKLAEKGDRFIRKMKLSLIGVIVLLIISISFGLITGLLTGIVFSIIYN